VDQWRAARTNYMLAFGWWPGNELDEIRERIQVKLRYRLVRDDDPDEGRIPVTPEQEPAFLEAMDQLRQSRRRTGATRRELYRDGDRPHRLLSSSVFRPGRSTSASMPALDRDRPRDRGGPACILGSAAASGALASSLTLTVIRHLRLDGSR
jgi:hypothetical protein